MIESLFFPLVFQNPLENYLSELDSIISTIQDSIAKSSNPTSMEKSSLHTTQARILLLTPPAVHDNESLSGARDSNVTRKYAQALMEKDFGSEQIVKVDINSLFEEKAKEMQGGLKTLLREDGLHISQKGYDVSLLTLFSTFELGSLGTSEEIILLSLPPMTFISILRSSMKLWWSRSRLTFQNWILFLFR